FLDIVVAVPPPTPDVTPTAASTIPSVGLSLPNADTQQKKPRSLWVDVDLNGALARGKVTIYIDGRKVARGRGGRLFSLGARLRDGTHSVYVSYAGNRNAAAANSPSYVLTVERKKITSLAMAET